MTIWGKLSNIMKKHLTVDLYIINKYLKAKKRFNTKESFQCFYIPVILFDSVYWKDGNYYQKVFLEKFINNIFFRGEIELSLGWKVHQVTLYIATPGPATLLEKRL